MEGVDSTVVHGYAVVPAGTELGVSVGIGGSELSVLPVGPIAVVTSRLPADRYGPEVWNEHGSDVEWLGEVVQDHHAVVQALVATTDVVPLRLPSIHPDLDTLQAVLAGQQAELTAALHRLHEQVELGAKIYLHDRPGGPAEARPATGRAYLEARARQARNREERQALLQAAAERVHAALSELSTDVILRKPQDPALSGRHEPMLLNGAYLVRRAGQPDFLRCAEAQQEAVADQGLEIEVTGPWPPYNFVAATPGPEGAP